MSAIRAGYKQTEVGVIPEDWDASTVGDSFEVCNQFRLPISQAVREKMSGPYPYYGPTNIQGWINEYRVEGEYALIGEDGDHFLKWRIQPMTLLVRGKFNVNNHAHIVQGAKNLTKWFYWFFANRDITPSLSRQGAGRYKLNKATLLKLHCVLPPYPEQVAITEALSDADALIESLEQLLAKKRHLKQGAMQELLTGKKRLPGFSGEWEVKQLGNVCSITTGKKDVNEGNPVGQYPFFTCARTNTFSDSYSFEGEAILIAGNGEVGNLSYCNGKFEAYQRTYVLQGFTVNVSYLWHQLSAYLADSLGIGKIGSSIPYIKMGNLIGFAFRSPCDASEQSTIAAVLSDMDAELADLEAQLDKSRALKQGMMQKLLTGDIRLAGAL